LTTPDAVTLARLQAEMVNRGLTHMVTEASSHALDQRRLAGIDFQAAAFTNLTGDHLDYHQTEDAYLAAKARLFQNLSATTTAVLNADSPQAQHLAEQTPAKVLWYGIDRPAELRADIQASRADGTIYEMQYDDERATVHSPLPGLHNVSNHLAAAGLCLSAGLTLETVAAGLAVAPLIPGRLEPVPWNGPFTVLVDYAHTDDALHNVLSTLKPLCRQQLTVVFGCGGDRDSSKRPRMAQVAAQWADRIVVTSDNPRHENPQTIVDDIVAGFAPGDRNHVIIEPDRQRAIETALDLAQPNDIVLIAGKGHETYQLVGDQRLDFSDKAVVQAHLQTREIQ
jgi:UDP-N-acetylmuramoyl-L-alanyl-D-glutamate--2,6-diaminopimelate ligase